MKYCVFFIGFGEAASSIAQGLNEAGVDSLAAFDIASKDPSIGETIRDRAKMCNVVLCDSIDESFGNAEFIFSLTSASAAVSVAKECVPFLSKRQLYVDMNSARPETKEIIASLCQEHHIPFCDAAIMNTVPGNGHRVPMLLAGDGAANLKKAMEPYGMRQKVLDTPAGSASAIKMIKSVIMKGLPQLMIESFVAADKYNVLDELVSSLAESLEGKTIEKLAETFVARTFIHAGRRRDEMIDVQKTLDSLACDCTMTKATILNLERMNESKEKPCFANLKANTPFRDVIHLLSNNDSDEY